MNECFDVIKRKYVNIFNDMLKVFDTISMEIDWTRVRFREGDGNHEEPLKSWIEYWTYVSSNLLNTKAKPTEIAVF